MKKPRNAKYLPPTDTDQRFQQIYMKFSGADVQINEPRIMHKSQTESRLPIVTTLKLVTLCLKEIAVPL
jgi:hypothetical protein